MILKGTFPEARKALTKIATGFNPRYGWQYIGTLSEIQKNL
jgi:hypothetical protein